MLAPQYPRRDSFFAHRLVRLMCRMCAAQEIGCDGVWLVTIVVHTEDAKKYSAPVTYWNEQLMSVAGWSIGQLQRARSKAIEAGWLHYEAGGKGKVGRYWATVPSNYAGLADVSTECDANAFLFKNEQDSVRETTDNRQRNDREVRNIPTVSYSESCTELNCTELARVDAAEPSDSPGDGRDAETIEPMPSGKLNPSAVYSSLTDKHLASARSMVEWFRRQLSASAPVLRGTREDLLLCLCCSARAREKGVKNQVGKFVTLTQSRRWPEVERYRAEAERAIDGPLAEAIGWAADVSPETKGGA